MERDVKFRGNFVSYGIFLFRKRMRLVNSHSDELGVFCISTVLQRRPFFPARNCCMSSYHRLLRTSQGGPPVAVLSAQDNCGHSSSPDSSMGILWTLLEITWPLWGAGRNPTILTAFLQRARSHHSTSKCLEQFEFQFPDHTHPPIPVSWAIFHLEYYCPVEFSAIIEVFYNCSI